MSRPTAGTGVKNSRSYIGIAQHAAKLRATVSKSGQSATRTIILG